MKICVPELGVSNLYFHFKRHYAILKSFGELVVKFAEFGVEN